MREHHCANHEGRDYLTFDHKERKLEAKCFEHIFQGLRGPIFLFEAFGGIGVLRTVLEGMGVQVLSHEAWDHSPRCIEVLRQTWPDGRYMQGDSFKGEVPGTAPPHLNMDPAQFVHSADFNTFSCLRLSKDRKYQHLVDQLFLAAPGRIQITDSAVYRMHLNKKYYSTLFGTEITDNPSYLTAASAWFYTRYGYSIAKAAWHRGASYYVLQPQEPTKFTPVKITEA